jgi:hypothetical protein
MWGLDCWVHGLARHLEDGRQNLTGTSWTQSRSSSVLARTGRRFDLTWLGWPFYLRRPREVRRIALARGLLPLSSLGGPGDLTPSNCQLERAVSPGGISHTASDSAQCHLRLFHMYSNARIWLSAQVIREQMMVSNRRKVANVLETDSPQEHAFNVDIENIIS